MSVPDIRSYRVSFPGSGAVWVTADSRRAACDLAERIWGENSALPGDGASPIEILDEYENGDAS
jgi:hypothetical protein